MCTDCLDLSADEFASQSDFEEFEGKVWKKCNEGELIVVDEYKTEPESNLIFESRFCYRCSNCEEVWLLSIPKNAWRGFFLPKQQAIEYTNRLKDNDKKRTLGFWVVAAIVILIILWYLMS